MWFHSPRIIIQISTKISILSRDSLHDILRLKWKLSLKQKLKKHLKKIKNYWIQLTVTHHHVFGAKESRWIKGIWLAGAIAWRCKWDTELKGGQWNTNLRIKISIIFSVNNPRKYGYHQNNYLVSLISTWFSSRTELAFAIIFSTDIKHSR